MERTIPVKTYYLEMRETPDYRLAPRPDCQIRLIRPISLSYYRMLYHQTGEDVGWIDRELMPDEELRAILDDPGVEVWALFDEEKPAGFAELIKNVSGEVKIAYFGILAGFRNRGLGLYFLKKITEIAWKGEVTRVWLHTCELDHPAALPNYLKAGYRIFEEKIEQQVIVE